MKEKTFLRLLEGIRRYGLENVSTLSKWIDIPIESARYMIWEELPRYNISVGVTVNLRMIGLDRWMLRFSPKDKTLTLRVEEFLSDGAGLMYLARAIPDNTGFALLGIPIGENQKLAEQLELLKNAKIIENYSLNRIKSSRNVSFNSHYYDFKARTWKPIDWEGLEKPKDFLLQEEQDEEKSFVVDYKDILILRELRKGVPRTLSKLSKPTALDQHNLRYHYKNHARQAISDYYLKFLPLDSSEFQSTMVFFYESSDGKDLNEVQSIALSIPFTQKIWKTDGLYCWQTSCPGEHTNGLLRYVNDRFVDLPGRLTMLTLDSSTEQILSIPAYLFDEEGGIWRFSPKVSPGTTRKP